MTYLQASGTDKDCIQTITDYQQFNVWTSSHMPAGRAAWKNHRRSLLFVWALSMWVICPVERTTGNMLQNLTDGNASQKTTESQRNANGSAPTPMTEEKRFTEVVKVSAPQNVE